MVSEQVVLRKTHLGYHETTGKLLSNDPQRHTKSIDNPLKPSFWSQMHDLSEHDSLMGCSIQPDPKAKNAAKVEAKVGFGLHQRHAYSITGVYEISFEEGKIKEFYTELQQVYNNFKKVIDDTEDDSLSSIHKELPDIKKLDTEERAPFHSIAYQIERHREGI